MRPDKTDFSFGPVLFDGFGNFGIVFQGRGRGMNDDVIEIFRFLKALFDLDVVRRTIHQFGIWHERSGLRKPGWIPEARDFAARLIARTSPAIETVERRRRKK